MRELVPEDDPVKGLGDFFDLLWEQQNGYVYLPIRNPILGPKDDGYWQKVMFAWPAERSKVIQFTLASTAQGRDVYAAPVIFKERRPIQENIKGSYTCWVDFDGNAPDSWPSVSTPVKGPGEAVADLTVLEGTPTPTLRIKSSRNGHEHVYWRFAEFQTDIEFIANTNRALAYKHKADTSGWDPNQVLRPPYTTNYKHKLPVTIEAATPHAYSSAHFAAFKRVKQVVNEYIEINDVPAVEKVIAKYKWDTRTFDMFMSPEIEEGKRSSSLMALGFFGAESGMSDEEIYSVLLSADDRWGKFKHRSDRQKRLTDIINRARLKHPVGTSSSENALRGLLSSAEGVQEVPEYVYGYRSFNELDIPIEWIIEGFLERRGMAMVSSAPGVGKTQFALQFGSSCALGEPFLIWPTLTRRRILWFSLEMHGPALQYFTHQMRREYTEEQMDILEENLLIVPLGEVLPLDHPEGRKFFEAMVDQYKPDGIIIDSVGKVTVEALEEKKAKELNSFYSSMRAKHDIFMLLVHHNRKANGESKKPKDLADLYGSQYVAQDLSTAIVLWKEEGKEGIEVNVVKSRLMQEPAPFWVKRNENLHLSHILEGVLDMEHSGLLKEVNSGDSSSGKSGPEDLQAPHFGL